MRSKVLKSVLGVVLWCACSGDDGEGVTSESAGVTSVGMTTTGMGMTSGGMTTSGTGSGTGSETTMGEAGAPFFISFSTNVGQITDGESVIFTAIVSDPDGFGDIAGGTLFTQDGKFSYGPFVSAGQEGTYSITVSWAAIDQVEAIEFENLEEERVFRAEFFDKGGHKVAQETTIKLRCDGGGACGGGCKDFKTDGANCGGCGVVCTNGCEGALCLPVRGECINSQSGFSDCNAYCQSVAEMCVAQGCEGATFLGYDSMLICQGEKGAFLYDDPCNAPQTWDANRSAIRCCCSETK